MPDYRKKKRSIFSAPKKNKKRSAPRVSAVDNDIKMTPQKRGVKKKKEAELRVVKGKKLAQKRRLRAVSVTIAAVAIVVMILQLAFPAGIIETVSNGLRLMGSGSYPIRLEGTKTLNTVSKGGYYYVLTNTYITACTGSGKSLFSYPHGFERPVLKVSAARALVFDQNGTQALIFNHKGLKSTVNTEKNILTAAISDSGNYALATRSDKYVAAVTVYSKKGERLYEWFSAENNVNALALSPNGKKLAVASFKSEVGQYNSNISVFNYKAVDPEFKKEFDNTLIYTLDTTHRSGFAVVSQNAISFIKWGRYKSSEYKNDYNVALFKASKNGLVAVFNRENDKTDNRIAVFSRGGVMKSEISFKGIISDIEVFGGHIYCISDTKIYLIGNNSEILRKTECGFGAVKLAVTETNTATVITDNKIEKFKLKQEKK